MNPITVFTKHPINHFKQSRWFYPVYDGTWFVLMAVLVGVLHATGYQPPVPTFADFRPEYLLTLPLLVYVLILCNVFAHNVSHRNFPKPLNRLVGEVVGFFVLSRYASWEIIHLRHHRYSDQPGKDPHDCIPGFWLHFLPYFVGNVEKQLKKAFYDQHGGETPENQRFQRWRALLSFGTGAMLFYTLFVLAGGPISLFLLVPAEIITIVHLAHFNWATHNGFSAARDYAPINLDRGFYYIGNRIFFGIYYHDNHHRMVKAFNPMRVDGAWLESRRAATIDPFDAEQDQFQPAAYHSGEFPTGEYQPGQ